MAKSPSTNTKMESLSKIFQELEINGQELPEKYIYKGKNAGVLNASLPSMEIPVVDIGILNSPLSNEDELEKLRSALSFFGCFQAVNHGIATTFLEKMREISLQFFAQPPEKKLKHPTASSCIHGYKNDLITENQTLEWSCRMNILVSPEDQRQLEFWPQYPENFGEILHEYGIKLGEISEEILKAMARSLKLDENCFLDMQGENSRIIARFNYFPPCPKSDKVLGFRPHTDGSVITIILPDKEVEGLQFLKGNQWYKATTLPQALLVNTGDQGEIISNGIFKSPIHRVVTNSQRQRISVAMFFVPNLEKEIEPVDGLISEERPRLYKKLKDYDNFYFQRYWRGEMPIEAVKI